MYAADDRVHERAKKTLAGNRPNIQKPVMIRTLGKKLENFLPVFQHYTNHTARINLETYNKRAIDVVRSLQR